MRRTRQTVQRHRDIAATQNGLTLVQKSLLLNPFKSGLLLLRSIRQEVKILRSHRLDRVRRAILAGDYLLQNNPVRPLIIQRATGDVQLLLRGTIVDALNGNNLFQGLLTGQLAKIIRCLNRETVIALGKFRKTRDTGGESIHLLIRVDALIRNVQIRTSYRLVRIRLVIARLPRTHRKELRNTGQQAAVIVLLARVRKIRTVDANHIEPARLQCTRRNCHLRAEIVIAKTRTVMQAVARQRNNMGENRVSHNLSRSRVCLIQSDVRLAVVPAYDVRGKNMVALNRQSRILPRLINR